MIPPWARDATAPTKDELEALTAAVDPRVLEVARDATAPTPEEVARLRLRADLPSRRSARAPWLLVAPAVVLLAWLGARWSAPVTHPIADPTEVATLYVLRPGDVVWPARGVRVEGEGTVRVIGDLVVVEGELRVDVEGSTRLRVAGRDYVAEHAVLEVGDAGLTVQLGVVVASDGEVLSVSAPTVVLEPEPEPEPPPPPPAPRPATSSEAAAWKALLAEIEAGLPDPKQLVRLREFRRAYPDSAFELEAQALELTTGARVDLPDLAVLRIEAWLRTHPDGPRALELHATAARIHRDRLGHCRLALPHDLVVAEQTEGTRRNTALALAGLCHVSLGERADGLRVLREVDAYQLPEPLRRQVYDARAGR